MQCIKFKTRRERQHPSLTDKINFAKGFPQVPVVDLSPKTKGHVHQHVTHNLVAVMSSPASTAQDIAVANHLFAETGAGSADALKSALQKKNPFAEGSAPSVPPVATVADSGVAQRAMKHPRKPGDHLNPAFYKPKPKADALIDARMDAGRVKKPVAEPVAMKSAQHHVDQLNPVFINAKPPLGHTRGATKALRAAEHNDNSAVDAMKSALAPLDDRHVTQRKARKKRLTRSTATTVEPVRLVQSAKGTSDTTPSPAPTKKTVGFQADVQAMDFCKEERASIARKILLDGIEQTLVQIES